ncbi:MAG: ubiquinone/menaquinone biosynthesis methyltransferase [Acidobacteria bacterium]|nr:ubiquinone/menaquinone biosynthesis methyltransferase [Acidobacteriota bacterium]
MRTPPSAPDTVTGTKPPGAEDQAAAARYVRQLFSDVSARYDLLNHLLSMNVDRYWRWAVARDFRHVLGRPTARVLDLCSGTGDLSLALARQGVAPVFSSDFAHSMLTRARAKYDGTRLPERSRIPVLAEADALQMPFPDASFDLITCAFGFRNLADYPGGLREILRLLRPGGELAILEFAEPTGFLAPAYSFYFHHILPAIGEWLTGVRGAYRYLASSVDRFPKGQGFVEMMRAAGFKDLRVRKFTGGIALLYVGKSEPRP